MPKFKLDLGDVPANYKIVKIMGERSRFGYMAKRRVFGPFWISLHEQLYVHEESAIKAIHNDIERRQTRGKLKSDRERQFFYDEMDGCLYDIVSGDLISKPEVPRPQKTNVV